jgi:hypothetical protein
MIGGGGLIITVNVTLIVVEPVAPFVPVTIRVPLYVPVPSPIGATETESVLGVTVEVGVTKSQPPFCAVTVVAKLSPVEVPDTCTDAGAGIEPGDWYVKFRLVGEAVTIDGDCGDTRAALSVGPTLMPVSPLADSTTE